MSFRVIAYPELPSSSPSVDSDQILLVLLHGWGANAADVAPMASYLQWPNSASRVQMIFPDAPFPHPLSGGRMWYSLTNDYTFGEAPAQQQQQELQQSRELLLNWLQGLEAQVGIPLSRTIMAGFSQGGAMTLDVGTCLPLAGLMILSGYLHDTLSDRPATLPPVLLVHGRQDPVVPLAAAHQSRDTLSQMGAAVQYHELDMGHDISPTVLKLMQTFIQEVQVSLEKSHQ